MQTMKIIQKKQHCVNTLSKKKKGGRKETTVRDSETVVCGYWTNNVMQTQGHWLGQFCSVWVCGVNKSQVSHETMEKQQIITLILKVPKASAMKRGSTSTGMHVSWPAVVLFVCV